MKLALILLMIFFIDSSCFSADSWRILSFKNNVTIIENGVKKVPVIGDTLSMTSEIITGEKSSIKILLNTGKNTYIFLVTANKTIKTYYLRTKESITGNKTTLLTSMLGNIFSAKTENTIFKREMLDTYIYPKGKVFKKPDLILWDIVSKAVAYQLEVTDIREGKKKSIISDADVFYVEYPEEMKKFGPDTDVFIKLQIKFKDIDDIVSKNFVFGPDSIDEWAKITQVLKNLSQNDITEQEKALILTEFFYSHHYYCESLAWALILKDSKSGYIDHKIQEICEKLEYNERKLKIFAEKAHLIRNI